MARRVVGMAAVGLALVLLATAGAYELMNSRTFQVTGELTARVTTAEKVVALTFDDGPTAADTEKVLAILAEQDVPATFFVNGAEVERSPESLRAIIGQGHQVGNHSWSHPRMILMGRSEIAREIEETDRVIHAANYAAPILFRPPHGKKLVGLPRYLAEHDRHTIMWDVAAEDYSSSTPQPPAEIAALTVTAVEPGSIILLHPWNGRLATQDATALVIARLKQQGYRFVTVDELLALSNR